MILHFNMKKINTIIISVFIINVVYLPNDTFQLKKLSFVLAILLNAFAFFKERQKDDLFFDFYGFIFPSLTILQSWVIMGDLLGNINSGFSGYMFLLYYVIKRYKIDYEKIFMIVLTSMAYFLCVMAILDFTHLIPTLNNPVLMWFHESANAMIGRGSRHAFGIIYFMKSSPLLLLALPYQIKERKTLSIIAVFCALLLSGTRANVVLSVVVLFSCYIYKDKNTKRRIVLVILEIVVLIYVALGTGLFQKIINAFTMKAADDQVRTLTLKSIFKVWEKDPLKLIWGSGYASTFFSEGRNEYVNTVELSYWNLIRRVGIISFLVLMYLYIKPIRMIKVNTILCFGYIAFLAMAYVDPVLYSSTGISAVLYMYYVMNLKQAVVADKGFDRGIRRLQKKTKRSKALIKV